MSEPFVPKIVTLPSVRPDARLVLARTMDKADHIESVAVIIRWKADHSVSLDWSDQKVSDLASASFVLQGKVLDLIRDGFVPGN